MRTAVLLLVSAILRAGEPFPMDKGTAWIYQGTVRWDESGTAQERPITWTMLVDDRQKRGDLDVAMMTGFPADLAFFSLDRKPSKWMLVRRGSDYFQIRGTALDPAALNGDSLMLHVPLTAGELFGEPDRVKKRDPMYCWSVEEAKRGKLEGIQGIDPRTPHNIYTLLYRSMPEHDVVTFVSGVGIVGYIFSHHGTLSEVNVRLVRLVRPLQ